MHKVFCPRKAESLSSIVGDLVDFPQKGSSWRGGEFKSNFEEENFVSVFLANFENISFWSFLLRLHLSDIFKA